MRIRNRLLLNPAAVEGGNGSTTTTTTEAPKTETASTTTTTAPKNDGFEALAAKHSNDGVGLARNLWDQLQAANAKVTELNSKVAPEGAVVLTGDQVKAWNRYTGLGKPEEIETKLTEGTAAIEKVVKFEREKHIGEVAKLVGFDADVLGTLAKDLEFEIADETVKGKTVKIAKVKDGDKLTPLADYAATAWPKFLPSLKAGATQTALKLGTPPNRPISGQGNQPVATSQGTESLPKERLIPFGRF